MKKYILILAILLGAITIGGGVATFGYSKNTASNIASNVLGSSVQVLPPYKTINSPFTAVAPRSSIVNYYSPTSIATSSAYYANTFCINNSSPDCITAWPTGGVGSIDLLSQIGDVSTTTLAVGSVIIYDGSVWQSSPTSSLGVTGGGGSGTVTSVDMSVPTGLTVSGNPITTAGTLAVSLQANYSIPLTASTTEGSIAYSWGDHKLQGYLTSYTESDPVWLAASSSYLTVSDASSTYQPIGSYLTSESDPVWLSASSSYLTTTTAASTYEPILTKGNLTATSPLQFNNTRQVIGGNAQISVASGYTIPSTASSSNWETAYLWGNHSDAGYLTSAIQNLAGLTNSSIALLGTTNRVSVATSSGQITLSTPQDLHTSALIQFGLVTSTTFCLTGDSCITEWPSGGSGLTSLNGQTGTSQTFASSTSGGLSLFINSATDVHTFTLQPASGYLIPLTASTTEWANTRNTVAAGATNWDIAYADRLKWDGSLVTNASTTNLTVATNAYLNVLNVTGKTTLGLVSTTAVTATTFYGTLTGNASTATALQNNPSDCSANQFAYQIDASGNLTCSSIDISASTNLGVTATGLELSGDNITLTSGYIIPLSASTTQWANFYNTPSTRITAGTNLYWSGNTLNASGGSGSDVNWATSTAGSDIILYPVSADYDVMFGDSTATATAPFWWDVSATSTYIGNGGYGDSVIQLGQVATAWTFGHKASDSSFVISSSTALGTNDVLVISKSTGAVRVVNALNASSTLAVTDTATFYGDLVVTTGLADFGGAVLEIPNGTNPTANDPGELAHDTTDNQLILDDYVMARATQKIWSATIASTSPAFISNGLLKVPTELDGYTMTAIRCSVQGGTSKVIAIEDESANSTEDITCTTSVTSDDGSITNASVSAEEEMYIDFGATSGTVDYVTISVFGTWTRE